MGRRKTTNEFIEAAMQKHPEFDYSETRYIDKYTKVKIICPIHGAFEIIPRNFFRYKHGCGKCGQKLNTTDVFIEKCIKKYGTKFSYTKVNYINSTTNVTITCPIHGDFEITPADFLRKEYGCPKCAKNYQLTTDDFINRSLKVHGNKYDYSKSIYVNKNTKVCIICPEHGEFWQKAEDHYLGHGCFACKLKSQTKLLEKLKRSFPNETFTWEYTNTWLGKQRIDICLEKYCVGIEYDGQQHYFPMNYFGGERSFKEQVEADALKNQKCKENGFTLFRVKYDYSDEDFYNLCVNIKEIINSKNVNDE